MKTVDLLLSADTIITCQGNGKPKTKDEMSDIGLIKNSSIAISGGTIVKIGKKDEIRESYKLDKDGREIDVKELVVLPGFIDSHTHPVFAGNRSKEFIMRAKGATYQEIHEAGGGIQFTVDNTRNASFNDLYFCAKKVLMRMLEHGTTTVEAKSGYGLEKEEELRELRVIKKLSEMLPLDVIPTFLGAHSIPREYKDNRQEYIRIIIEEMLPAVKEENLAEYTDIFCEEGAFTVEESRLILEEAKKLGFKLKIHAEEFTNSGSAVMAGKLGAISADHLLKISDENIEELKRTKTILTLMPGTLFFLNYNEFAPARKIIDSGAFLSLATDYNAGSCMSASMQMAMSLACIKMKMTPEEAINSATYNASFAVGKEKIVGSLEESKKADIVIYDVDDYRLIPYHFGENLVKMVIKDGKVVVER